MGIPAKLGKYEIRRELGSGAMGVVYEGWDPGIGRRVAIKTVKREQLDRAESAEVLARFQREAQAAGRLSHPNIVPIYEFGEQPDDGSGAGAVSFIAMEFIEGRELKDHFDHDERFALPEIVRIMAELLSALGHAHKHGIVHRDIKPANIILLADGTVKVADFGIARLESSNLTQAGSVLGTPSYMSPEQFMGQTIDGRSDLFSAGVVLYQFLTGEKPFTGALTTIMHKVLKEEPPPPSELNVQVPRPFDALMKKALAKRPEDRFQSAEEFAAALKAAAAPAAEATLVDATAAPFAGGAEATLVNAPPPAAAVPAATAAPARRNLLPIAAAGAAVVVGIGAWLALRAPAPAPEAMPAAPAPAPPVAAKVSAGDTLTITAVGLADPADPRYAQDKGLMGADLREDLKRQLVEKAAALYVAPASLAEHYGLLQTRLLAHAGDYIQTLDEAQPQLGKDGLMHLSAKAAIKVRDVQKSLNQMSRDERIEFIRNNGDPKISVAIATRSADADPAAPAARSPAAENLLKERIQSFGFRIWSDEAKTGADFAVTGEAKFKRVSARLEASGITIEKFVLTSWTVKCTDAKSGEEIYYNTKIPEKQSWATEDLALREIGSLLGEEFSKSFFLQHFHFAGQKLALNFKGMPDGGTQAALLQELSNLRSVLAVNAQGDGRFEAELSGGGGNPADLVAETILQPLNRKLGKTCFNVAGASASEVAIAFEAACNNAATLGRFDSLPPAALITAPQPRREAVIRNPETLKKLSI